MLEIGKRYYEFLKTREAMNELSKTRGEFLKIYLTIKIFQKSMNFKYQKFKEVNIFKWNQKTKTHSGIQLPRLY
ncbi:MAG: hypothetical protein ABF289_03015 [Clostridiales bacterium]